MSVYIFNPRSKMVHLSVDGRTFESCNLDDIPRSTRLVGGSVGDPEADAEKDRRLADGYRLCKRCFKEIA